MPSQQCQSTEGNLCMWWRHQKRKIQRDLTVSNWVFAQITRIFRSKRNFVWDSYNCDFSSELLKWLRRCMASNLRFSIALAIRLYNSLYCHASSDNKKWNNKAIVDHTSPALCTPIIPRQWRNGAFCCCMTLFTAKMLQCIVSGEENSQNCAFPLGFCHPAGEGPSHGHRQHAQKNW